MRAPFTSRRACGQGSGANTGPRSARRSASARRNKDRRACPRLQTLVLAIIAVGRGGRHVEELAAAREHRRPMAVGEQPGVADGADRGHLENTGCTIGGVSRCTKRTHSRHASLTTLVMALALVQSSDPFYKLISV